MKAPEAALDALWPRPRELRRGRAGLRLDAPLRLAVEGEAPWLPAAAAALVQTLSRAAGRRVADGGASGVPLRVIPMDALRGRSPVRPVREPEGYVLEVSPQGVLVAGADARGVGHAAQRLGELLRSDPRALPGLAVRDWPRFAFRGAHCYLPARRQFGFFERFLDLLAQWKYNTLILEVGGGLEYERHPEINEAWKRFCHVADHYEPREDPTCVRFKQRHPRGANALQGSRYYWKDSTHTELAGGEWLTKREVARLLEQCRARGIEVIPEVQSLSHSYYLCCAHPEIAERRDDPWPDTYCISNPKTYELLFDVMEEVIALFQPRIMHIGHDELYHIGVCPRCRRKSGHDLLTSDLRRIHAFLAARGVRPMMWGDKLMNFRSADGEPQGGARIEQKDPWTGKSWVIRETYEAAERVPKDILICDWYWSLDPKSERNFHKRGFEVVYGNFSPMGFKEFEKRANLPFVHGAEISTWCEVSPYAFGHNGVFHTFFAGADVLWTGRQMPREEVSARMARRLPALIDAVAAAPRALAEGRADAVPIRLAGAVTPLAETLAGKVPAPKRVYTTTGAGPFDLETDRRGIWSRAIVLGKSNPLSAPVRIERKAAKVLLLHGTTMQGLFRQPTFYSYHRGPAEVLRYRVEYADGRKAEFAADFRDDIGPVVGAWPPQPGGNAFRAVPVTLGDYSLYAVEWDNPRPDVPIRAITPSVGKDASETGEALVAAISIIA